MDQRPKLSMPVIAPPPAGADRQTYYNAAAVDSKIAMLPAAQQGMEIYLDNGAQNDKFDVFSFTDGLLTYDPTTPGILVLHIHPLYVYWLRSNKPPGTSAPQVIRYENVRVATIGPALLLWLKTFYLKALQEGAGLPHETNVDVLAAKYLEQFFLGKVAVWVEGGMKIGEADDLDATHRGIRFLATYNGLSVSIVVLLRELPSYGDPIWSGHPLALAALLEDIPVSIYAQFEVYDVQQKRFIALPAGVTVDLMDSDLLSPDDRLATAVTNASGQVEFVFQDAAAIDDVHGADLFLLVHTNGMAHAAHAALPQEWSTKGWLAVDGTPGYQSDFGGTTLGTADAPLIFRIGVDFHLSIQYIVDGQTYGAPPNVPVRFVNALQDFTTDAKGCIEGFWMNADAGSDLLFEITCRIGAQADPAVLVFDSPDPLLWHEELRDIETTSFGEPLNFQPLIVAEELSRAGLYALKAFLEVNQFMSLLTGGIWEGLSGVHITLKPLLLTNSISWPVGSVGIVKRHLFKRSTLVHEITHQIVWQVLDFHTWALFAGYATNLHPRHGNNLRSNPEQALAEGWPEAIAEIFTNRWPATLGQLYGSMTLTGDDYDQSDPVTIVNGDGERVEGHWVLAMADVFWDHVAGSFQPSSQEISSSYNGDLLLKESWLNNPAVGQRFMDYIWWPLVNLVQAGDRSVRELIEQMRLLNPADWPALRTTLQKQKMAFPVIDRLQPLTGDKAGGEHVSIYGAHFTDGAPAVSFNNVPAMGVHVLSGNELLILTPAGAVGHCNVVVSNAAGASAPAAFHYL